MTDVIIYLHQLINNFNENQECGFCWVFTAPLNNSTGNTYQIRDDNCKCVHFIVHRQRTSNNPTYGNVFHALSQNIIRHTINFHVGLIAEFSENNWDEIKGYDLEDSRYFKYLKPLQGCITIKKLNEFCNILGYPMRISNLDFETIPNPNIYDENFVGYSVTLIIEEIRR